METGVELNRRKVCGSRVWKLDEWDDGGEVTARSRTGLDGVTEKPEWCEGVFVHAG
jgi:hypothetical protein